MTDTYDITVDQSALSRIEALRKAGSPEFAADAKLRVAVEGGGCSGFQYRIEAADKVWEDDIVYNGAVVIDEISAQYLKGSVIRFQNDMMGAMFIVDNPNAQSSCGCKTSFSIDPAKLA